MNANVATQMITYFPLRWPVSIYMLLVIFFIRVFQNERFNRFLRFFASLINNNGTLRKCYLFSYRCKNFWSIKCHWNVIKRNDSGSLVLNRITKWTIFVRNRVRVWRPRRQSSTQTSVEFPTATERSEKNTRLIKLCPLGYPLKESIDRTRENCPCCINLSV